jgi:preprotein translocase subunit SecA
LFGERLAIDLDNAMYSVCLGLGEQYAEHKDKEAFKVEVMKHLVIEAEIRDEDFTKADPNVIGEALYHQVKDFYHRKMSALREHMLPQLQQILEQNGDRIDSIAIPFTDGIRGLQVYASLKESVEQAALPIVQTLEKNITLSMIDDAWKNHLRAMDDLRTSVRMASYEQKDPLLIYKFEAFNLFKHMLVETNRNIISFLLRAGIPIQEAPHETRRMPEQHTDMSHMHVNKAEIDARGQSYAADEEDYYTEAPDPMPVKRAPIQTGPKIGRNDPCPCGSGKKYKSCHGKGAEG